MARTGTLLLATVLGLVAGCADGRGTGDRAGRPPGSPWISAHQRDNPLVGRVWARAQARFVAPRSLARAVGAADFALLGEKHDNPDHHRIQAWLVARMIAAGRHPAVAFEMLTNEQAPALEAYLAAHPDDAAGIGAAVGWKESGWPPWASYRAIAAAALDDRAAILPASLPPSALMALAREGLAALDPSLARPLEGAVPLPEPLRAGLREEIVRGHCNRLPAPLIDPMVTVQTVKDAVMARTMMRGAALPGRDGAVLIAGNGHVRDDRGVPWHLRRWLGQPRVVAVGLVEVSAGADRVADYGDDIGDDGLAFDFVWFTPRVDEDDPCEKYAEQLDRAGASKPAQTSE